MTPATQTILFEEGSVVQGNCLQAAVATILDLPLEAVPHFAQFGRRWFDALAMYASSQGRQIVKHQSAPADQVVLAFGDSPRGVRHAVVWQDAAMLHDPHPSHAGLVGAPDEFWALVEEMDS